MRPFHQEEEAGIPIGGVRLCAYCKVSGVRVMLTTLALAAAVTTFSHAPMVQTRADVFCTSERACNCPYYVSFCTQACHTDARVGCGPTHKAITVRDD